MADGDREQLEAWPWKPEWLEGTTPLDLHWTFDLQVSREALWEKLSNTSDVNRRMGLDPMNLTEKGGHLHGEIKVGLNHMVWEELPWTWVYPSELAYVRLYSKGPARVIRTRTRLEARGDDATRIHAYVGMVPRNRLMRFVLNLAMRGFQDRYGRVLSAFEAEIRGAATSSVPANSRLAPGGQSKLDAVQRALLDDESGPGIDATVVERLTKHVSDAPDDELDRIRPLALARAWSLDADEVVRACLHATRQGLLTLTWDVVCPHCRGVRDTLEHLGEVAPRGDCEVCDIDFDTSERETLEVTFHVHPSVRRVEKRLYCAAEPATKAHVKVQQDVEPGRRQSLETVLAPGSYRFRVRGGRSFARLLIEKDGTSEDAAELRASEPSGELHLHPGTPLTLINDGSKLETLVVEEAEADRDALRPVQVFGLQDFRDLFDEESLAVDLRLDVGVQTVMFTDVVGSTRFYLDAGDAAAFREVRQHFVIAFDVIKRHHGIIVKTIGDAIMASFADPADAVAASIAMQRRFGPGHEESQLRIRITLHTGPCLAVNLNTGVDYFGTTINLAAKIQASAEAGQVAFTEDTWKDPGVQSLLRDRGFDPDELAFEFRQAERSIPLYRIDVE